VPARYYLQKNLYDTLTTIPDELKDVDVFDWDLPAATSLENAFLKNTRVKKVVITGDSLTNFARCFQECTADYVDISGCPNATNLTKVASGEYAGTRKGPLELILPEATNADTRGMMYYNTWTKSVSIGDGTGTIQVSNGLGMFSNATALTEVNGIVDISSWKYTTTTFDHIAKNCSKLTKLYLKGYGISGCAALSLAQSPLDHDSLVYLFENLYDRAAAELDALAITLSATSYGYLTEDEIAVATEKGYTVGK